LEFGGVGLLEFLAGIGEALSVTGRGLALAPVKGDVERGDAIRYFGQGLPLCFRRDLPVADALELGVRDALNQRLGGVEPKVASVSHDGGNDRTHLLGRPRTLMGCRLEMSGEMEGVIDLNQQIGKPDVPHILV